MPTARGRFDVEMSATGAEPPGGNPHLGRMRVDKQYYGDLEARAHGEALTAITPVRGSAGYVLIERVEGTLAGRTGSFVLQHSGVLDRGAPTLHVEVVPDSGTEALAGILGRMTIRIETDGTHLYQLEYELPSSANRGSEPASGAG